MMPRLRSTLVLLLLLSGFGWAAIDTYNFEDDARRQRFTQLTEELRCPKCQNQNIADSDAPIAFDLRRAIYEQIQQGASDAEIIDYMVHRYGDFVLYRPALNTRTLLLWGGPVLFLLLGLVLLIVQIRSRRQEAGPKPLSAEEQARVEQLLGGRQQEQDKS